MKETIFDLVQREPREGQQGFFDIAEGAPKPKDNSWLKRMKEYEKSIIKGSAEGFYALGRAIGPVGLSQEEKVSEALDKYLPTENEEYGQRALRRGLKGAPLAAALPGAGPALLGRQMASGFVGEAAKDLGAPEWAQSALEVTSFVGPDVTKKLLSSGKNKELIESAKKLGMSDEQIAPLLNGEFKQKWLAKLAPKKGHTQKALENTKEGLTNAYTKIQESEPAISTMTEARERGLQKKLGDQLGNMPANVRDKIKQDTLDLFSKPVTGKSLMNYYADINSLLGPEAKQLSLLKNPIQEAIHSISPALGKDFQMVNKLYGKYQSMSKLLKPNITSDLISAAEHIGILGSIALGHYPSLVSILGEQLAKKVSQQMLINPHFQQIGRKMILALNQNKYALAQKAMNDYINLIGKNNPEAAEKLKEMGPEQLQEFFNDQR